VKRAQPVKPWPVRVRAARGALSQPEAAGRIGCPVSTLRDWEQGRYPPPGSALLVARLAVEHPQVLRPYAAAAG
jgi:putative transcriptional regulator